MRRFVRRLQECARLNRDGRDDAGDVAADDADGEDERRGERDESVRDGCGTGSERLGGDRRRRGCERWCWRVRMRGCGRGCGLR